MCWEKKIKFCQISEFSVLSQQWNNRGQWRRDEAESISRFVHILQNMQHTSHGFIWLVLNYWLVFVRKLNYNKLQPNKSNMWTDLNLKICRWVKLFNIACGSLIFLIPLSDDVIENCIQRADEKFTLVNRQSQIYASAEPLIQNPLKSLN